jgi:hypothetical protein
MLPRRALSSSDRGGGGDTPPTENALEVALRGALDAPDAGSVSKFYETLMTSPVRRGLWLARPVRDGASDGTGRGRAIALMAATRRDLRPPTHALRR